jgi:hypothetical protein
MQLFVIISFFLVAVLSVLMSVHRISMPDEKSVESNFINGGTKTADGMNEIGSMDQSFAQQWTVGTEYI